MGSKVTGSRERLGTPAFIGSLFLAGVCVFGVAIFVGQSDQGQINVTATIQDSNAERAGDGQTEQIATVPETFKNMPNGGLVPQGGDAAQAEPVAIESAPATSTESAATTTETSEPAQETQAQ